MDQAAPWRGYVARLCADAFRLDDHSTEKVLARFEVLAHSEVIFDSDVAKVLYDAGVAESTADLIAPSIRVYLSA